MQKLQTIYEHDKTPWHRLVDFQLNFTKLFAMTLLLIYPPTSSLLTSLAAYLSLKDAGSLKLFPKTAQNLFIYKKNWRPITLLMTCNITEGSFRTTLISSSTFVLHGKYISGGQGESKRLIASAEKQIRVSVLTVLTNRTNIVTMPYGKGN